MSTNRDFYNSLDEFGKIVYITNFVRNLPGHYDTESRLGQQKIKALFNEHLDRPYNENK